MEETKKNSDARESSLIKDDKRTESPSKRNASPMEEDKLNTEENDWSKEMPINEEEIKTGKDRVVFLSSKSRTYFPQDPGVSRFGIAYAMNCAPGDVPNPNYLPSDNRLTKPISTKGYSIGGLSGLRFPKDVYMNNPAPNAYQHWVAVPQPTRKVAKKKDEKVKKMSYSESGATGASDKKASLAHDEESDQSTLSLAISIKHKAAHDLCLQRVIGFGSHLKVPRFTKDTKFQNVGVGYYDLQHPDASIAIAGSFGQSPVKLIQPTATRCNYKGYDKCFECDELLKTTDYYRTSRKINNPFYHINSNDRVGALDLDDVLLSHQSSAASASLNLKHVIVSLCRSCYCRAKRGQSEFWDKAQVPRLFQKVRHCSYIHDHRNMPSFTHKTDCRFIRKLQRKEVLMSKYYKDSCERILKSTT